MCNSASQIITCLATYLDAGKPLELLYAKQFFRKGNCEVVKRNTTGDSDERLGNQQGYNLRTHVVYGWLSTTERVWAKA